MAGGLNVILPPNERDSTILSSSFMDTELKNNTAEAIALLVALCMISLGASSLVGCVELLFKWDWILAIGVGASLCLLIRQIIYELRGHCERSVACTVAICVAVIVGMLCDWYEGVPLRESLYSSRDLGLPVLMEVGLAMVILIDGFVWSRDRKPMANGDGQSTRRVAARLPLRLVNGKGHFSIASLCIVIAAVGVITGRMVSSRRLRVQEEMDHVAMIDSSGTFMVTKIVERDRLLGTCYLRGILIDRRKRGLVQSHRWSAVKRQIEVERTMRARPSLVVVISDQGETAMEATLACEAVDDLVRNMPRVVSPR